MRKFALKSATICRKLTFVELRAFFVDLCVTIIYKLHKNP